MSGDAADEEEDKQLEQNFSELQVRLPFFPQKNDEEHGYPMDRHEIAWQP
jgi:hypothetical protein